MSQIKRKDLGDRIWWDGLLDIVSQILVFFTAFMTIFASIPQEDQVTAEPNPGTLNS